MGETASLLFHLGCSKKEPGSEIFLVLHFYFFYKQFFL